MRNICNILFIALFEKDVLKIVAVVAAAIGGGIVKVIFENRTKKITFLGTVASLFTSVFLCYICFFSMMKIFSFETCVITIGFVGILSDRILSYIYSNSSEMIKALINKLWGINSK